MTGRLVHQPGESVTRKYPWEDDSASLVKIEGGVARVNRGRVSDDAGLLRKGMARNIPSQLRDRRDGETIETWAQRSPTRCASCRLAPRRDAIAEVTIATARGDLPAYFAILSSDGPRPGVVVIHDIAGMTPDAPNQADWLAAEGSWLSHPTRCRGAGTAASFGRPHIDEQLFSWTPHRRQRVRGLASLSRRPIHDRGLQSPRDEEEGETS